MKMPAPWERRRRFSDDFDFIEPRRYSAPVIPKSSLRGLQPSAGRPFLFQRDPITIARPQPVGFKNEVTVINRRIAKGSRSKSPKPDLIAGAVKSAISVRNAFAKAVPTSIRRPSVAAKAIAADRRFQNFSTFPKNVDGTAATVVPRTTSKLQFLVPSAVLPCVQRTTRREVLFASKRAGGRASHSPKRLSPYSHIGC